MSQFVALTVSCGGFRVFFLSHRFALALFLFYRQSAVFVLRIAFVCKSRNEKKQKGGEGSYGFRMPAVDCAKYL